LTVDSGQWTVDSGQWTVDSGRAMGLIGFMAEGLWGFAANGQLSTVKYLFASHVRGLLEQCSRGMREIPIFIMRFE
jgi:hypothetical protein